MSTQSSGARKIAKLATSATLAPVRDVALDIGTSHGDQFNLTLRLHGDQIVSVKLTGVGCRALLQALTEWRPRFSGSINNIELPTGSSHIDLMLRELILKARSEWKFPYLDLELCHCRAITTEKVDAAIVAGCHSGRAVARETSAGTSCGTCLRDTQSIIEYRLKRP